MSAARAEDTEVAEDETTPGKPMLVSGYFEVLQENVGHLCVELRILGSSAFADTLAQSIAERTGGDPKLVLTKRVEVTKAEAAWIRAHDLEVGLELYDEWLQSLSDINMYTLMGMLAAVRDEQGVTPEEAEAVAEAVAEVAPEEGEAV